MNIIDSTELVAREVRNEELTRSQIRNLIHRIRSNRVFDKWHKERAPGIQMIFSSQFREVRVGNGHSEMMSWNNFTYLWDVHPMYMLKIVSPPNAWEQEGGEWDEKFKKQGIFIHKPPAFTRQPR